MTSTRLSTSAFAVLVVATIGAFFVTQHLKVTTPLIAGYPSFVPTAINPSHPTRCGRYNSGSAKISFWLQHRSDTVDVYVIDQAQDLVDTLATGRRMRTYKRYAFHWNGREANGQVAPDGTYYLRVALREQGATIDLNQAPLNAPVKVKTVPPHPVITSVTPSQIPTASGSTRVTIRYRGNENRGGTIFIYRTDLPGGPRLVKTFLTPWKGQTAVWDGTIHQRPAPAGTYLIGLEVTDAACNTGRFPAQIPPAPGTPDTTVAVG